MTKREWYIELSNHLNIKEIAEKYGYNYQTLKNLRSNKDAKVSDAYINGVLRAFYIEANLEKAELTGLLNTIEEEEIIDWESD